MGEKEGENPFRISIAGGNDKNSDYDDSDYLETFRRLCPNGLGTIKNEKYLALCSRKPDIVEDISGIGRSKIDPKYFRLEEPSAGQGKSSSQSLSNLSVTLTPGKWEKGRITLSRALS